jgi:hypothetical protein
MDRHGFGQALDAGVGQGDNYAAPVPGGVASTYQTLVDQPCDPASQSRAREERAGGELRHPQFAAGFGQLGQYVEVGDGQAGLLSEIGVELTHQRGLRLKQSAPRVLSAPTWHRLLDKPAEESGQITR